jgi:phospholipase/lecithinase/hemolysin
VANLLAPAPPCPASAAALQQNSGVIERLYVFGDSYSDGGNGYALMKKPPTPPYAARYSNGMTAAEHMAKAFGLTLHYSKNAGAPADGSLNFAVSGAWTSRKNNDAAIDGTTGLLGQIASFEQRRKAGKARFDPESTLFFIAIGANDLLFGNIAGQDSRTLVADALRNMETAARLLHTQGARHLAIATIPMVNRTPRGAALAPEKARAVGEAVLAVNDGYRRLAAKLRADLKADVFSLPWGRYYDDLMSNPSAFGMADAGSCIRNAPGGITVCPDPQGFVFFDALHPTTAAHRVVGYRLATESRSYVVCPERLPESMTTERPVCRFASAADGVAADARPAAGQQVAETCTRVAFRQTSDMCNNCTAPPWNGEVNKTSGEEWILTYVDGGKRSGSARWRLKTASESEMVFHDVNRDLYTRFDFVTRKGFQRRGLGGSWMAVADLLDPACK